MSRTASSMGPQVPGRRFAPECGSTRRPWRCEEDGLTITRSQGAVRAHRRHHTVEEESEHVAAIISSSNKMSSMLGTLLTLARSDANEDELRYECTCISDILQTASSQFAQIGAGKGLSFSADIEPALTVLGDAKRLEELFSVLLDNAVRYTQPGGSVRVRCAASNGAVEVSVQDTGIGMPEADLRTVFERFYRGERAREVNPEGMGLGLAIAQWKADRHQASIHVDSEEEKGTTIVLTFPRERSNDAPPPPQDATP